MTHVPLMMVDSFDGNPRSTLGDVGELAVTVEAHGVIEPIVVMERGGRYVVLSGHRRVAAAREAGLDLIPAVIRETADADAPVIALIANLHREPLTPIDEAKAFKALLQSGVTQRRLALRLGMSQAHISKRLALLNLPDDQQRAVDEGRVPIDHALAPLRTKRTEAATAARAKEALLETGLRPRPNVDAGRVLQRLVDRESENGLYFSAEECEVIEALLRRALSLVKGSAVEPESVIA